MHQFNTFIDSRYYALEELREKIGPQYNLYFGSRLGNVKIRLKENVKVPISGVPITGVRVGFSRYEPEAFLIRIDLEDNVLIIEAHATILLRMNFDSFMVIDEY